MGSVSPSYKGHRYPVEVISQCVWLYFRFPLSFCEVEELMLQRGVVVSYETVRRWCRKFGQAYADGLRRRRPRPHVLAARNQACARYVKETGARELRVPYDYVTPDGWVPAGFPLGTWLADQRKSHKAGCLDAGRVEQLDGLGMVWSHQDVAFEEGLTAARAWAKVHGHLLPPATATAG